MILVLAILVLAVQTVQLPCAVLWSCPGRLSDTQSLPLAMLVVETARSRGREGDEKQSDSLMRFYKDEMLVFIECMYT